MQAPALGEKIKERRRTAPEENRFGLKKIKTRCMKPCNVPLALHLCVGQNFFLPRLYENFFFPPQPVLTAEKRSDRERKIAPGSFRQMRAGWDKILAGAPKSDYKKENRVCIIQNIIN